MTAPLDPFVPRCDVRERHSIVVRAPAETVFAAAAAFDLQSLTFIRAIIRARQILLHSTRVERQPQPFLQEAIQMGWGVLAREPGRCFVAGARCQPWLGDVVFTPVSPAEFAAYAEPNQVKIAWTLEVESLGPDSSRLATETRAVATDEAARKRFRGYWRWARFGIVAIRWLMLPAIRRQAERDWRRTSR
ncbi:MAG TPA: hypothetical protein VMJ30_03345 [Gemmatimonadales bacterium]|nr:hypothetical protein [Gemmatimonadales bacterium]